MSLLSITDLQFGYRPNQPIFDGLHLHLEAGHAVILDGPNGAGKSTLMNIAAGILRPTSGQVTLAGKAAHTIAGRRARWHMTSHPALFRLLTVREQLEFYAAAHGRDPAEALKLVEELIPEDVSDQLCAQLSTGQAQKVWFAAALAAHYSPVLLLDEPFSAIDVESVLRMIELVETERRAGRAIVTVTHTHQELLPYTWVKTELRSLSRADTGERLQ